jgi:hypothetical protein
MSVRHRWLVSIALVVVAGCASSESDSSSTDDALTASNSSFNEPTLLWEGNWAFLTKCDSFSRSQGKVVFACDENPGQDFVDNEAWVAVPKNTFRRSLCGMTAHVCKGDTCIDAKVVDHGEGAHFEGSSGVLTALGEDSGFKGCNSSFGTVNGVTITID